MLAFTILEGIGQCGYFVESIYLFQVDTPVNIARHGISKLFNQYEFSQLPKIFIYTTRVAPLIEQIGLIP